MGKAARRTAHNIRRQAQIARFERMVEIQPALHPLDKLALEVWDKEWAVHQGTSAWPGWLAYGLGSLDQFIQAERSHPQPHYRVWVSDSLRGFIKKRDGYRCQSCSCEDDLTIDHIHPVSAGGLTTPANLQTLCGSCNRQKGSQV